MNSLGHNRRTRSMHAAATHRPGRSSVTVQEGSTRNTPITPEALRNLRPKARPVSRVSREDSRHRNRHDCRGCRRSQRTFRCRVSPRSSPSFEPSIVRAGSSVAAAAEPPQNWAAIPVAILPSRTAVNGTCRQRSSPYSPRVGGRWPFRCRDQCRGRDWPQRTQHPSILPSSVP